MTGANHGPGPLICGAGGVLLLVSLFLPWADLPRPELPGFPGTDSSSTGWELWTMADLLLATAGLVAIATALTGGRFGVFRPDVSLIGAADILGVISSVLLAWLLLFDFPEGASREIGAYLAFVGAAAVAGGAGDYSTLRGAPLFPRLDDR